MRARHPRALRQAILGARSSARISTHAVLSTGTTRRTITTRTMKTSCCTLPIERPTILSIGLGLMAVKASLWIFFCGVAGTIGPLALFIASANERGDDAAGLAIAGVVVAMACLFFIAMHLFTIFACWRAWHLSRGWLWVVTFLAAISILFLDVIGLLVGIPVVVGVVQAFERLAAAPGSPGSPGTPMKHGAPGTPGTQGTPGTPAG